jgi:D-sedoheptulose 7-phosphate isomerase
MMSPATLSKRNGHGDGLERGDPVHDYLCGLAAAIDGISRAEVWAAVDVLLEATEQGRRIYLVGNGGSAATASHMAVDLAKQAAVEGAPRLRAIALTDNVPLITAWSNDEDYGAAFARQLQNHVEAGDVLVAISTSGNSPNVLRAAELARACGARVVAFTGDVGGALRDLADACVYVPSPDVGHQEIAHLAVDHVIAVAIQHRMTVA